MNSPWELYSCSETMNSPSVPMQRGFFFFNSDVLLVAVMHLFYMCQENEKCCTLFKKNNLSEAFLKVPCLMVDILEERNLSKNCNGLCNMERQSISVCV